MIALLSVVSTVLYVAQSYGVGGEKEALFYDNIEAVFVVIYMLDWMLFFCVTDHMLGYIFSVSSLVDLISIPVIVLCWHQSPTQVRDIETWEGQYSEGDAGDDPGFWHSSFWRLFWAYVLRVLRTTRLLRITKLNRLPVLVDSELQKKLLEIIIGIVSVPVFFSGLLQVGCPAQGVAALEVSAAARHAYTLSPEFCSHHARLTPWSLPRFRSWRCSTRRTRTTASTRGYTT